MTSAVLVSGELLTEVEGAGGSGDWARVLVEGFAAVEVEEDPCWTLRAFFSARGQPEMRW